MGANPQTERLLDACDRDGKPSTRSEFEIAIDLCTTSLFSLAHHNKGLLTEDVSKQIGAQIRSRLKWLRKTRHVKITMDGRHASLYNWYASYVEFRADLPKARTSQNIQRGFNGKIRLKMSVLLTILYALADMEHAIARVPWSETLELMLRIDATSARRQEPVIPVFPLFFSLLVLILTPCDRALALSHNRFITTPAYGQAGAKRALEIAAAGGHNLLLLGPPGCGKTMLARRLPSILPPMTSNEALEVTKVYSVAGLLGSRPGIVRARPFRFPHHTISQTALVGGGSVVKPGEISLAHHGVLFLDELPEFARGAIEVMRQPIEEGTVTIARASGTFTYPARFMLVASMNP
jgi:hypothetical protein